jgi:TPR repeat protein
VIDWHRTGINQPIPVDVACSLIREIYDDPAELSDIDAAVRWAAEAEIGANRKTRQCLLSLDNTTQTLTGHDYVIDHQQRHPDATVPNAVWQTALNRAPYDSLWPLATAAHDAHEYQVVLKACGPLAAAGHSDAMFNIDVLLSLGVRLEESDPDARRLYEQAAAAGNSSAMYNLGLLLEGSAPDAARRWFERAAAGYNSHAMYKLGLLLEDSDPDAAHRWYERAAAAGDNDARLLLDRQRPDPARG